MSSATRSEMVTRVRPVSRAMSARLCGAGAVEGLEHERAVVRPSVLRQHLGARAQGTAGGEAVRAVREAGAGGGGRLADGRASLRFRCSHVC